MPVIFSIGKCKPSYWLLSCFQWLFYIIAYALTPPFGCVSVYWTITCWKGEYQRNFTQLVCMVELLSMLKLQIAECSSLLTLPLTSLFIVLFLFCQFFPGFSHVALLLYKLIGFHALPTQPQHPPHHTQPCPK